MNDDAEKRAWVAHTQNRITLAAADAERAAAEVEAIARRIRESAETFRLEAEKVMEMFRKKLDDDCVDVDPVPTWDDPIGKWGVYEKEKELEKAVVELDSFLCRGGYASMRCTAAPLTALTYTALRLSGYTGGPTLAEYTR